MKGKKARTALLFFAALVMILSIWGPEALTGYRDRAILDRIHAQPMETEGEGYRYILSPNEKLHILSECLNSQITAESEQSALSRQNTEGLQYQDVAGAYAFVINHRGPTGKEITSEEIFEECNKGLEILKEAGIIPDTVRRVEEAAYDAVLYSAIDVLEPRNNVAVWKLGLSNSQRNANKQNRLIDAYIDADNGKIYEFYVRTQLTWADINPDEIVEKWSGYLGLSTPAPYEVENPLLESTPYYEKYVFDGMGEDRTIVTIGYYEGIRELFLKISK